MLPIPGTNQNGRQLFYCNGKISTEINGDARWRILQANDLILAQNNQKTPGLPSALAACDQQRSVFSMYEGKSPKSYAYSPYGHHTQGSGLLSLLAFNGERRDAVTGHYHLGNGYRQFSPVMMRFCNPDSWSPFGVGGYNAYVYCAGDPANRTDPTGHVGVKAAILRKLNPRKPNTLPLPRSERVKPKLPLSKTYINKRDGSGGVIPRPSQTAGDAVPFESLFTQSEIAEQYSLLARFSAPEGASSKKSDLRVHGKDVDLKATERYANSMKAYKSALQEEARLYFRSDLVKEWSRIDSRLSKPGPSRDLTTVAVLEAEWIRRYT